MTIMPVMPNQNSNQAEADQQSLLPQVRLMWFFAAITASAVLIMLVRWAGQGQALITAIVSIIAWVGGLAGVFAVIFLLTYSLGLLEVLLAPPENEVLSPFASDRLPEQIVTPSHIDDK